MTSALHDQSLAAFDEAAGVVHRLPGVAVPRNPVINRVMRKWLQGGPFYYGKLRSLDEHGWTSCGHVPSPALCFGLATMPGYLMCGPCWLHAARQDRDACDFCGRSTDGAVIDLYPALCAIGPAVVLLVLCQDHVMTESADFWRRHVRDTLRDTR